jgi:hypothetical protein
VPPGGAVVPIEDGRRPIADLIAELTPSEDDALPEVC